ncbi:S8 family serine peptidase [Paenisporosarcina sp.]|uniref:S8 family serine peptidase n=1 Tax=Paenisporosarcina sp. TaxID=1932001 RepID=UPI003C730F1A
MNKFIAGISITGLILFSGNSVVSADEHDEKRMLVVFDEELTEQEMIETVLDAGGEMTEAYAEVDMASVEMTIEEVAELREDPSVQLVEEDFIIKLSAQMEDWGIASTRVPSAWNSGFTGKGIKVAVIDSGISTHSDLQIAGGVSTVSYTSSYNDDEGHGTHVAGIIGARNNSFGVKGVAYETELYAVKAFNRDGEAYLSDLIEGIDWSIANGMDIINLSSGTQTSTRSFLNVVNKAYDSGLLIVAAAGNDGAPDGLDDTVDFPARYASVIGVGAVDRYFGRASFSSTGPEVEVAAPGVDILSTYLDNQYAYMSGTSMATPYVTGQLALLKQAYPELTNDQLRQVLTDHTLDLGKTGRDPLFGYGFIQASSYLDPVEFEKANPLTGMILSENSISGSPGLVRNVTATATYTNGANQNVTSEAVWTSNNPAVAEVTSGKVELKGYGTTTVTVTYKEQTAVIVVDVPLPQIETNPVMKLEATNTSLIGKPGDSLDVTVKATYKNGQVENVTGIAEWSSSNTSVATVIGGKVQFNGYGTTTITATYEGQSTMIVINSPEPQPQAAPKFEDVTSFYSPAVTYLVQRQITRGVSTTEFGVAQNIIRADAAIWLAKELGLNTETAKASGFTDVPERAIGAVNALKEAGIVGGKTTTRFGAYDTLTRGEVAIILQRGYKLSSDGSKLPFTDVSSKYSNAVGALVENAITDGITPTKFGVSYPITRGQLAVFMYRLSEI